ncbi:MAG TPA: LytTR family DNA-binding domain-containing protein [Spirochaetota bacterium]|nr:LytTR family DNA-binding domain-containing protein [Spirochaetota bacterium]HPQ54502.1 LytTR family DNA-binding domain-containing protein [Spirochaetota bacterium]
MHNNNSIHVLIAEDELPARELLIEYILTRHELRLHGIAKDGEETLHKLSEDQYDLLFLDINLPVMSGIEVLEQLDVLPYVIFTTAYDRYAIKAFEMGAVDYLIKPFTLERFNRSVNKALSLIHNNGTFMSSLSQIGLSFKQGENHYLLSYNDIIYITSNGRHSIIHTEGKDFETAILLKEMEQKVPGSLFMRIHKQCIVNISFVSHVQYLMGGQYEMFLKDNEGTSLTVGRKYARDLKRTLGI